MKKSISKVLTLMLSFAMVFTSIGWIGASEVNAEDEGTTATLYLQVKDTNGDPVKDAGMYLEPRDPDSGTYTGDLMVDLDAPDTDGMIQINGDDLVNDYDDFSFYINDDEILFRIDSENYESDPVEGKLATDGSAWSFNLIGGKGDSASNPVVFTVPAAGGEDLQPAPPTTVPRTEGTEVRSKKMTVDIDMSKYPAGQVVKVWVPVPQTEDFQTVTEPQFEAKTAKTAKITEMTTADGFKNKMLYIEWDANADPSTRKASMYFFATRVEAGHSELVKYDESDYVWPEDVAPYITKTSEMVKIDGIVKDYADEITKNKKGTLEKAEAIYKWIINNLERIDNGETLEGKDGKTKTFTVEGCGYGDTKQILEDFDEYGRAGGHCTDLNSTFVGLCRAAGIPAREMFGIRLGENETDNASGFQHCWAEFYLPGTGWVFADPADVLKKIKPGKNLPISKWTEARESAACTQWTEYFWGTVDNNRIVLSRGRDITFNPPQAWGTCNTFGYPAAEVDGKRNPLDFTVPGDFVYTYTTKNAEQIDYVKVQAGKVADKSWADYGTNATDFDKYFILDVRPDDNWQKGHLPGATHVAVTNSGDLENRDGYDYIKAGSNTAKALDAAYAAAGDKPILVVCVKGKTLAARALQYFNEKYFSSWEVDLDKVTYLIGGAEDGGIPEGTELETKVDYVKMRTANPSTWKAAGIAYDAITAGDFVLDVRPDDKWKAGHIKGSTHVDVTVEAGLDNGYVKAGSDLEKALDAAYTAAGSKRIVIVCNGGQTLAARAMQYYNEKHYGGFGVDFAKVTYLIGGATAIPKDVMVTGDDVTPAPAPAAPAVTDGQTATVGGNTYKVTSASAKTAAFTKAKKSKKSATVPATVTVNGVKLNVTSIAPKAFKGTKVKTLTVKSKKLTKKSVKGSLKGSKVKTVKVKVGKKKENKKYVKKYKKIFTKKNCGKKVKVK